MADRLVRKSWFERAASASWLAALCVCVLVAGACSGSDEGADPAAPGVDTPTVDGADSDPPIADEPAPTEIVHAEAVDRILELLPDDTAGVVVADLARLRDDVSAAAVDGLLAGAGTSPLISELLGAIGAASPVALTDASTAVLAYGTDGVTSVVVATVPSTVDGLGPDPSDVGGGRTAALLPDGLLVVGSAGAVAEVIAGGAAGGPLAPFVDVVIGGGSVEFVLGLPGLVDAARRDEATLQGASALSGSLSLTGGDVSGELVLHAARVDDYAAAYNALNRHATQAEGATEAPLEVTASATGGVDRAVLTLPTWSLEASEDELVEVRNLAKKFFVGMDAHAYAETVPGGGAPWFDLIGTSEADGTDPPTPASVFFRWRFRDDAALAAFEANELPAGYRIAPTRFFETDAPEGEKFFLLNLYNAGGGSIVGGARAEWDVYVYSPDGGPDPNPGERPRFFVVDALAEQVSFDPVNLVTPAEPLSHAIVDGVVTSDVGRFDGESTVPVWSSSFPQPDPTVNEVARFTREMAIGNDYIYWGYGAADRVLYNGTTYNHDAFFIDPADVAFVDNSRWAQYLDPELVDVVYYDNSLEYVVSPLTNLESDQLDITPEWRDELIGFKGNGHQVGLMRKAVELLFRGQADAMVGFDVTNETPSTYIHFEVTDPAGFVDAIDLPADLDLAPIALLDGEAARFFLTLSVFEIEGSLEGVRAEWSTYVDRGDGRPKQFVIELQTERVGIEPTRILNLPSQVEHVVDGTVVRTRLGGAGLSLEASFGTTGADARELTMDWVEAGDVVCYRGGVCDSLFYDAETLDVPVGVAANPSVTATTPWDDFLAAGPAEVFFRPNAQEYAVKRWFNLEVPIAELPFSGIDGATHTIVGVGTLLGRTNSVVDSDYAYSGEARIDGDQFVFALDQEITNALGVGNIFTTGSFDLTTGTGTQTVVDCLGPALLCSDIVNGTTSIYTAGSLDASDPDSIAWDVTLPIVLGGAFGVADSESEFRALRLS